ncbi:hypothetical protein NFI96_033668, partial [Prochilodus magdalenae]
ASKHIRKLVNPTTTKLTMSTPLSPNGQQHLRFGETSFDILSDFLTNLNNKNKSNLENVSSNCGNFKVKKVIEHVFLMCEQLELDPLVGYHAVEILDRQVTGLVKEESHQLLSWSDSEWQRVIFSDESRFSLGGDANESVCGGTVVSTKINGVLSCSRFMVKHTGNLLSSQKSRTSEGSHEDLIFQSLEGKFLIFLLSSVQIASKLSLHSKAVDNNSASTYLQSLGKSCPREKLLESELFILKTLDFQLSVPNPLLYVETLLEVLGHNDPSTPVAQLHHLCRYVLQFIYLQREPIYHSLLVAAAGCLNPSPEQRCVAQFVSVTADCMLLGVGVITVSAYVYLKPCDWEKVVEELALITGISSKSIMDFDHAVLTHITKKKAL